jgi:polar amino acid transport system substrate-binding protein
MRLALASIFLSILFGVAPAGSQSAPIKVAVYVAPPFVMKTSDGYTGFAWDLWQQVGNELDLKFDVREVRTVEQLLQLVHDKQVDIAVANLSITAERFHQMDFSQPWFDAGLRIMIDEDRHTGLSTLIFDLKQSGHLRIYAWLGIILVVATIVLTLIDRRWHPEFPEEWPQGLAESFRHVMSVAMTGSTSHRNLLGAAGTALGALWLACGVAVVAYVTSSVTSVMTASAITHQINSFNDLRGKHIGAMAGTVGESYCRDAMLDVQSFDTMDQAVDALLKGQIAAIVRDAPVLEWFDNAHPELPVTVVGPVFKSERYGFALPTGSPLTRQISEVILRLKDRGTLDTLRTRYFGTTR